MHELLDTALIDVIYNQETFANSIVNAPNGCGSMKVGVVKNFAIISCPLPQPWASSYVTGMCTFHDPDLVIDRPEKFGGRVTFSTYEELKEAYVMEQVYPLDLKNSVATQLNLVLF